MQLQAARPVLRIDPAHRQPDAQPEVGRPPQQRRKRSLCLCRVLGVLARRVDSGGGRGEPVLCLGHLELLQRRRQLRDAVQIGEAHLPARPRHKRPQMRQQGGRDAAALVRDAEDDVLWGLADEHVDRGWQGGGVGARPVLDDGLHAVAQQLADDVLEVAGDVGEGRVEVALEADGGELDRGPVGLAGQGGYGGCAT